MQPGVAGRRLSAFQAPGIQAENPRGHHLEGEAGRQLLGLESRPILKEETQFLARISDSPQDLAQATGSEQRHQIRAVQAPLVPAGDEGIAAGQAVPAGVDVNGVVGAVGEVVPHQNLAH